jgi:hypothetical protein
VGNHTRSTLEIITSREYINDGRACRWGCKKHLDDLWAGVANAKAAGIMSGTSWVLGLPGETIGAVAETERFILELIGLGLDVADVWKLQIFPGTEYYE